MKNIRFVAPHFHLIQLLISFVWVVSTLGCSPLASDRYSDKAMIDVFLKNEDRFDKLAKMADAESEVIRVADSFTRTRKSYAWPRPESEWGITKSRWDEYKALFAQIGITNGMDIEDSEEFGRLTLFMVRGCGHFSGCNDREKGYVHSHSELMPLVDSIDSLPQDTRRESRIYMRISPNWYIYENPD